MRHFCWTAMCAVASLQFLAGCQDTGAPTDPTAAAQSPGFAATALSDPATVGLAAGVLSIDRDAGTAEFLPVRGTSAIGDTFSELGLAPAFTEMFGTNFRVAGLRRTGATTVEVDFEITHPFPAATRPDLAVFNLKAWIVSDDPATPLSGVTAVTGLVTNADGYGQMWSTTANTLPAFATADLQPYVILNEDPSSNPFDWQNPAGFNVFFPGQSSVDTVGLDLGPATQTSVRLFITGDYGQSAVRATRQTPAYELPQFAGEAAWKIAVTEISNDLEGGQTGSTASYQVDIWDWKHGQSLGSDVASATLSVPGITTSPLTIGLSGTGQDPTPLTGTVLVTNAAGASDGDYWGLVTVTDAATNGIGLKEDLTTPITVTSYVTYQVFPVSVDTASLAPTALITRCFGGDLNQTIGDRFNGSGSTDGSNPITTWEWDWDYDGSTFDVESTGAEVSHAWDTTGVYTVALRVSDGGSGTDIDTTVVNVTGTPSWSAGVRLTNNAIFENYLGTYARVSNSMASTPDGHVHLIYPLLTGTFPNYTMETWHQEYGGCPPTMLTPTLIRSTNNTSNNLWNTSAVELNGVLHASYTGSTSSGTYPQYAHASYQNGTWTLHGDITTNSATGQHWNSGYLATTGDGKLGFAGHRAISGICPGIPAPPRPVLFTEYSGSSWAPLTQIGDQHVVLSSSSCGGYSHALFGLSIAGTADGEWIVAWGTFATQYDGFTPVGANSTADLRWNRTTSGAWGTQNILLPGGASQHDNPILRRSPNGTIWLLDNSGLNSSASMATYDGTTWSPLTLVLNSAIGGWYYADMSFDSAGRGFFTNSNSQPGASVRAKTFLQTDTLATIAAAPIQTIEPSGSNYRLGPVLAPITDGRFLCAWLTDKYGGGPFTAREIDYSIYQ